MKGKWHRVLGWTRSRRSRHSFCPYSFGENFAIWPHRFLERVGNMSKTVQNRTWYTQYKLSQEEEISVRERWEGKRLCTSGDLRIGGRNPENEGILVKNPGSYFLLGRLWSLFHSHDAERTLAGKKTQVGDVQWAYVRQNVSMLHNVSQEIRISKPSRKEHWCHCVSFGQLAEIVRFLNLPLMMCQPETSCGRAFTRS